MLSAAAYVLGSLLQLVDLGLGVFELGRLLNGVGVGAGKTAEWSWC